MLTAIPSHAPPIASGTLFARADGSKETPESMSMNLDTVWKLIKETFVRWEDDKAPRLGASLAYYTLFAIAPILIIVIALAGAIFGRDAVEGQIFREIGGLVGTTSALAVQEIIKNASKPADSIIATVIGLVTLLIGATGVFVELQDALNTIWGVKPKPGRGIRGILQDRLLSFAIIVGVGFLLLVSLVVSAGLAALNSFLATMPGAAYLWNTLSLVISFAVITVLFGMIYKVLPDVKITWGDVWIGAAMTSLLFTFGKFLIGLYIGTSTFASTYGAAGSIVILLVWVYYSSLLLFLGAEFTQVYANYTGNRVLPSKNAVPLVEISVPDYTPGDHERDLADGKKKVIVDAEGKARNAASPHAQDGPGKKSVMGESGEVDGLRSDGAATQHSSRAAGTASAVGDGQG